MYHRTARYLVKAMLLVAVVSGPPLRAGDEGVRFRPVQEGMNEALRANKPMLLFFTAEWCEPCQQMKRSVFLSPSVATLVEKEFVPIEVLDRRREEGSNRAEIEALIENMSVSGFPTLVVYRVNGTAAIRNAGYTSAPKTINFLRGAAAQLRQAEERAARSKRK